MILVLAHFRVNECQERRLTSVLKKREQVMTNSNQTSTQISTLVVSRNSGQHSKVARELAARELHAVVAELTALTGQDLSSEIPSEQALIQKLRSATRQKSKTPAGKPFSNEYVLEHLPVSNAAVLVSTGTGVKLDQSLSQPFLKHVGEVVMTLRPDLLFVHRLDRLFRHELACAELLMILKETGCELADGELGYQAPGSIGSLMTIIRSQGAAEEAKRIPQKTRDGMTARTGTAMSATSVPYAAGVMPPPGLTVIRMRSQQGTKGEAVLFFDRPSDLPDSLVVAYGRPEVKIYGELVDQVAIVREILATLGKPGYGIAQVARNAMKRGFSTHKLRLTHGMSAQWQDHARADSPGTAIRAVISNLDFYETGLFTAKLGVEGVEDLKITSCFPDENVWATPEDFKRIREYLKNTKGGSPATLGLVGVEVTTQHGVGYLRKAPAGVDPTGSGYIVRAKKGTKLRACLTVIPHQLLAESIVEGLIKKAETSWIPLELSETPEIGNLQAKIASAQRQLDTLNAKAEQLLETVVSGEVTGELLEDLNRRYDELKSGLIASQAATVARLETDLAELSAKIAEANRGVEDSMLLELVASLRDPKNTRWNDLWKKAVTIDIQRRPITIHGHKGTRVAFKGVLRITGAGHTFESPFEGSFLTGAASEVQEKVDQVIQNLRDGIPYSKQTDVTQKKELRAAVAKHLGLRGTEHRLLRTADDVEVRDIMIRMGLLSPDALAA